MDYQLLNERVKKSHLTKTEIANNMSISRTTLDAILNGSQTTRIIQLEQLCDIVKCDIRDLFQPLSESETNANRTDNKYKKLQKRIGELEERLRIIEAIANERKEVLDTLLPYFRSLTQQNK